MAEISYLNCRHECATLLYCHPADVFELLTLSSNVCHLSQRTKHLHMYNLSLACVNSMVRTLKCLIFCDILIYVFLACFEFSKAGLYHLASHVCSLSCNFPPSPPPPPPYAPLVLQSVVDHGFQYSLPPFLSFSVHCLLVFYSYYF